MFQNALVSVSDKSGLDDFLRPYADAGLRIVSSGGTAKYLEEKGFQVIHVSEQTQFPEVMGGRVKTLHPYIHMPLLQRSHVEEDQRILQDYKLMPFDLVVVNLYPFQQGLMNKKSEKEMVELIDIGGPSLLRASAKNFESVSVICDPSDYEWVSKEKNLDLNTRRKLAAKVFQHVSHYDHCIGTYLTDQNLTLPLGERHKVLRYGENPQQKGEWYRSGKQGIHQAEILQGKELSYNNLLDLDAAVETLSLFNDTPAVISVKHNNPCGVATGTTIEAALGLSLKADPVSVFGGIVAMNRALDEKCAEQLVGLFLECVVAPEVTEEARKILASKKNLRVLLWPGLESYAGNKSLSFRSISGGYLTQDPDSVSIDKNQWKVVSGDLNEDDWQGLQFAWRVCAALKSNAIAVTSTDQSLGLGMGQVNRVDAVEQAFTRALQFHAQQTQRYLASDAFFPFPDSIERAAKYGVKAIVQPGGSIKDDEVIAKAKELGVTMVFTGTRHFRH
jgi:phosphoribosylaminoimidazolecarboxamide formyltransferase/IMP cyclohydrolase